MPAIRKIFGALLISIACSAPALAQQHGLAGARPDADLPRVSSPLARDIDRQLRNNARDLNLQLSNEQSRVNARSTSGIQERQTARDVQLSEQRLNTLKTEKPRARSIPLLERRLDRVNRPTGDISRNPGLESGFSTSLGLSGQVGRE